MKKTTIAPIVLLGVTLAFLILVFGKVMVSPNQYVFSTSEDAVKSYFNFSYYLKYDSGIRHDGINYPYGDHLQYINSHPLYIQVLKFIDRIFPVADKGVGILNLTMIFSLLAAIPFIYLILRKFSLPPWYAVITTMIILFLSPQLDRLGGHFEMVYAFFIPLYWYLLIRFGEGRRKGLWTTLLLLTALVGGFTSAYYAAFLAIFPMAILLVQLWEHRKNMKAYLPNGLMLLAIAVVPLVVVKGLVSVTDWVDDRPDNPWGFFIFHSTLFSIFLPPGSMIQEILKPIVDIGFQWEGRAYVGLPATLLALSFVFTIGYHLVTRKKTNWKFFFPEKRMNLYLASAVIVLLFAMCFPFKWFRFLPDLLPPLKQFRCLGRFSWIFYYVFTVYTALFFYRFFRLASRRGFHQTALVILVLVLSYWGIEAAANVKKSTKRIFNHNSIITNNNEETLAALYDSGLEAGDFQGILFLPYASTCGDKLLFTRGMHAFSRAMKVSYHTGIPLIQSFSPRISFTHAMSSIQLLADSTIYKRRVDDMNGKPLLIVTTGEQLNGPESNLYSRAREFWSDGDGTLASLPVEAFNAGHDTWLELAGSLSDSLVCHTPVCSNISPELVIYNGFESDMARQKFTGKGARFQRRGTFELLNMELYPSFGDGPVEISLWLYVDHRTDNMPAPELWAWDGNNKMIHKEKLESRTTHNVDGMWARVAHILEPEEGVRYQLTLRGKYITVDDLLVKPIGERVVIDRGNGPELLDNFRIPVAALE